MLSGMSSASSYACPQHKQVMMLQALSQAVDAERRQRIPERPCRKWGKGGEGQVAKEVTLELGRVLQMGSPESTKALGSE